MTRVDFRVLACLVVLSSLSESVAAHPIPNTANTLVTVPATGVVSHANDEAYLTLNVEEQGKDKAAAASRVNQKMKQGVELVRRQDPSAVLSTHGYYTYPVYPDEPARSRPGEAKMPVAWRVGEYLDVRTGNLGALPKVVAASQDQLSVVGLRFGLSDAAAKTLDARLIAATYESLTERIAAIAKAMGRPMADLRLESADFEGIPNYSPKRDVPAVNMMRAATTNAPPIEEPSFEPGETSVTMHVVGKVRLK